MKHGRQAPTADQLTEQRLALVEQQLTKTSRNYIAAAHAQARAEQQTAALLLTVAWLLRAYTVLARIRPLYAPPARVLDTGTPGVEVGQ